MADEKDYEIAYGSIFFILFFFFLVGFESLDLLGSKNFFINAFIKEY